MNSEQINTKKSRPTIVSAGACVELGNDLVLDDVTFSIDQGKKVAVVGPNGGGKSTLFNAIVGLLPLANGSIKIDGKNPQEAKSLISYVPQKDFMNRSFPITVNQVVGMGLVDKNTFFNSNNRESKNKITTSLESVGLLDQIDTNINNLSGGQFQRVLIARALTQNAQIILLDEAFSAVDVGAQEDIMNIINKNDLDSKTVLIATHDINNLEERFDEVLCLNRHCCAYGKPSEVLTEKVIEEMYGSHSAMFKNHTLNSHGETND